MFRTNLPGWERLARIVAGAAMIACGLLAIGFNLTGIAVAAVGAMTALSGLVGFCPACAMAGRRLAKKAQQA